MGTGLLAIGGLIFIILVVVAVVFLFFSPGSNEK